MQKAYLGNTPIEFGYLGNQQIDTSLISTSSTPLSIQYIAVGGGTGGAYIKSTLNGAPGGGGGFWYTSSLSLPLNDYVTITTGSFGRGGTFSVPASTSGGTTIIKSSTNTTIIDTNATGNGGGAGGAGATNGGSPPSLNCGQSAPAGGIVWLDGSGYAGGGGGGACGTDAFCTTGGDGTNGGGHGADTPTVGVRGGGGGGGRGGNKTDATNGSNGIVVLRYAGATQATGGTITSAGGYTYHTFTVNGTFTYTG